MRRFLPALLGLLVATSLVAQSTDGSTPDFGLGITIGAQSFANPAYLGETLTPGVPSTITYQSIGMTPELAIGKFGIGLDVTLNYRFTAGDGSEFEVRREDWIPGEDRTFLELYLPKFRYVRWGLKGDPLFVQLGSFENGTLGNGFIMGNYANTRYLPERRIFGMSLDVDGALFNFPYLGIETFAGNLAVFDVIGSRLFVRPLIGTGIPIVRNLQVGGSVVIDRNPFQFAPTDADVSAFLPSGAAEDEARVLIWGADFRLPILANPVVSLAGFGDYVMQNANSGAMLGAGGRLFGIMTYGAQLRFLGQDFIPVYFDGAYDLFRPAKYAVYAGVPGFTTDPYVGWFATAGFSILDDQVVFAANVDGPFGETDPADTFKKPHLLATFRLEEGILGGFSFDASYDKKGIDTLADLIDPANSVIGARVNYRIENATISLVYDLRYNPFPLPGQDPWTITSKIESAITLF